MTKGLGGTHRGSVFTPLSPELFGAHGGLRVPVPGHQHRSASPRMTLQDSFLQPQRAARRCHHHAHPLPLPTPGIFQQQQTHFQPVTTSTAIPPGCSHPRSIFFLSSSPPVTFSSSGAISPPTQPPHRHQRCLALHSGCSCPARSPQSQTHLGQAGRTLLLQRGRTRLLFPISAPGLWAGIFCRSWGRLVPPANASLWSSDESNSPLTRGMTAFPPFEGSSQEH